MNRRDFLTQTTGAAFCAAVATDVFSSEEPLRPNILWLTAEDANVSWFRAFGGSNPADTPNIDRLAREGFRYTRCFANAPVCSPSRSTWITGMHALSNGTQHMRSRYNIPHDKIRYYPDFLREAGYHCTNHRKTDYNIGGRRDDRCWDGGHRLGWRHRSEGQPFFAVVNFLQSHESRAFRHINRTRHDPDEINLRAYHPDLPDIRRNYARYQDAVSNMDSAVGEVLEELEKDNLADDTLVFFCSDHGGVLPRSKRFIFDSGIHSPFIARIPEKFRHLWPSAKPGSAVERIVSFVDMPKTWLSLAGAEIPDTMQGRVFLGSGDEGEREFHFSYRGRMDERPDNARSVRSKDFLYIRNYMPYVPWGQRLRYLWRMPAARAWDQHHRAGLTDETTGRFFRRKEAVEELYDARSDPDNVVNLAEDPRYGSVLQKMRSALSKWQLEIFDSGLLPESEVVRLSGGSDLTIYEYVRRGDLYDLPKYMRAADFALFAKPADEDELVGMMDDDDLGLRYWASVGLFLIGAESSTAVDSIEKALDDESHEVRAMAAWSLFEMGQKDVARECILKLLKQRSCASLTLLNLIEWMDDDRDVYRPTIKSISFSNDYEQRMEAHLTSD